MQLDNNLEIKYIVGSKVYYKMNQEKRRLQLPIMILPKSSTTSLNISAMKAHPMLGVLFFPLSPQTAKGPCTKYQRIIAPSSPHKVKIPLFT
jgi:hypothetical protein